MGWSNRTRDGKEPSLLGFGSVRVLTAGFGSVRVLHKCRKFGFGSGSVLIFCYEFGSVLYEFGSVLYEFGCLTVLKLAVPVPQ